MLLASVSVALPGSSASRGFASTIARLSEDGGFFDSNNLVSNERSYLHVVPALREARLEGGVYLGVGPDQNFTYIAHTRPSVAFIVDIRRDNLLLHLLFKALFQLSSTRAEYLSALCGRSAPSGGSWKDEGIERIADYVEGAAAPPDIVESLRARVNAVIKGFGLPLSGEDFETIDRFHRTFIDRGLGLQFESAGRPPRRYYPTYRELLLETDNAGQRCNYLASERDFQFVRALQRRDLVIPVVGDLAGTTAVPAIGRLLRERRQKLSAFYTSNVEYYLSGPAYPRFLENLRALPHNNRSVIIRAIFPNRYGWVPTTGPNYLSASQVQRVDELLAAAAAGRIQSYRDLLDGR